MIIDRKYVEARKAEIIRAIRSGKIFIYPTDTIYGIGCNALKEKSVIKIRLLKQREWKPLSVIAPNKTWIKKCCRVNEEVQKYLDKLPGPYTLFLRTKSGNNAPEAVNPLDDGTLGVRIPKHWWSELIAEAGVPFITTSVNVSGRPYMTNLEGLDETIKNNVDFIIYEGEIRRRESKKVDLTK